MEAATRSIAAAAREGDLVCIRSTVPIGTTRRLAESLQAKRLLWAACPDRSLSGCTFAGQRQTPHLVGGLGPAAGDLAANLLGVLGSVVRVRDPETAEAIKLFANVSRYVTFALANQFAVICEAAGINVSEVRAAGAEGYSRFALPRPGPVGGPCLTKDVHVLAASAATKGLDLRLLTIARAMNESLTPRIAREILQQLGQSRGPVAILGLAFKGLPATRDQRFAFGPELAGLLASARPELEIRLWDPVVTPDTKLRDAALLGATVVVLANDHPDLADAVHAARRLAPDAVVRDVAGVLTPETAPSDLIVRRFGDPERRR
jgi:UDP-N-acetyl-D-mannosaminuronic acid dehydrogenase